MSETSEIILCYACRGYGYFVRAPLEDHYREESAEIKESCPYCEGKGRLHKVTTIQYKPL